jgi:release factor glutamine methyltransferase
MANEDYEIAAGATIASVLRQSPLDALDMRVLLSHALGLSRAQLVTRADHELNQLEARLLSGLVRRRLQGEPIAYIVGTREFYGMSFAVTPEVLIPRPETELLVDLAMQYLPQAGRALDLGTGSGAIAIAIKRNRSDADVTALDASEAALNIARLNADAHGASVHLLHSDWYNSLPSVKFDLIVSNPPYIVAGDEHLNHGDLRFEPRDALTDHADGLSALRIIIEGAPAYLHADGWLLMEHGYDQATAVRALLASGGFDAVQSWRDLAGIERVSGGRLKPADQHPAS